MTVVMYGILYYNMNDIVFKILNDQQYKCWLVYGHFEVTVREAEA